MSPSLETWTNASGLPFISPIVSKTSQKSTVTILLTFAPPRAALATNLTHCSRFPLIDAVAQIWPTAYGGVYSSALVHASSRSLSEGETGTNRNRHGGKGFETLL
ncbi:hypothetical protein NM208_g12314 [Fusarium decemcellulare]|uniref:Uncharacterized protein n=1 Tax=Fusarium decemcellulare TaxID=57161 RepID=A0ACC1RR56_9HYPO|nr:hypothetical protein NM208_g12314 [Fusarium decemcellulare]